MKILRVLPFSFLPPVRWDRNNYEYLLLFPNIYGAYHQKWTLSLISEIKDIETFIIRLERVESDIISDYGTGLKILLIYI